MFTSTASQIKNDCVIVALANGTGLSYETIQTELGVMPSPKNGIQHSVWSSYLLRNGWIKRQSIPRRGQDSITGIVRLYSNVKVTGHLVWMKNGIVYDSLYPNGLAIKEYQSRTSRKHIQQIWIKSISTVIKDDSIFDLNFCLTLK